MSKKNEIIDDVVETDETDTFDNQFGDILNTLSIFKTQITALSNQIKGLEKTVKKEIKGYKKEINKRPKTTKKLSGFANAGPISNELCDFLGKKHGTLMARTDVTRFVCKYVKDKDLQNNENKKKINPDKKLKKLLGVGDNDELTYFNIQSYMNKHFNKKVEKEEEKV